MPERGIYRASSIKGYATPTNAPIRVDTTTNLPMIAPNGSGTTEYTLSLAISASGARIAAGSANFASGVATVNTGLTSVLSFQIAINATGFATGATEVSDAVVSAITTGSVTVQGYRLQTTTASASGTGLFYWLAIGL